jgi:hypothetical protein
MEWTREKERGKVQSKVTNQSMVIVAGEIDMRSGLDPTPSLTSALALSKIYSTPSSTIKFIAIM